MAQKGVQRDSQKLFCLLCLDLLKDPVTIPCGHSYCMNCIKTQWDGEGNTGVTRCPQCGKKFTSRPELVKDFMLAELAEDLKESGLPETDPAEKQKMMVEVSRRNIQQRIQEREKERETWTNISPTLTEEDVLLSPREPKTRADFLKYYHEITLDPNTANYYLLLSEGNRKVTTKKQKQSYPHHSHRFIYWTQVLGRESLTGRCYWEVEWRGRVLVAVTYKKIRRSGYSYDSGFGYNDSSWALKCEPNQYLYFYNKVQTLISGPVSSRIGVYLNYRAGILSFYSVSETMTLLHRVQTTFTQPLYAGVCLHYCDGDAAEFIKVK